MTGYLRYILHSLSENTLAYLVSRGLCAWAEMHLSILVSRELGACRTALSHTTQEQMEEWRAEWFTADRSTAYSHLFTYIPGIRFAHGKTER